MIITVFFKFNRNKTFAYYAVEFFDLKIKIMKKKIFV